MANSVCLQYAEILSASPPRHDNFYRYSDFIIACCGVLFKLHWQRMRQIMEERAFGVPNLGLKPRYIIKQMKFHMLF
jgi:hypothetical protein